MKKTALILVLFLMIILPKMKAQNSNFYTKSWKVVDSLNAKQLPRDVAKTVDIIHKRAIAENNQDQILKCYIYYFKSSTSRENYFDTLVYNMEKDVKVAPFPNNAMMHYMLAVLYNEYYSYQQWSIDARTEIADFKPEDIQTWTTENFVQTIIFHFNAALKDATKLQQTPIGFYNELIDKGSKPIELQPTLYDFLASNIVNNFSTNEPNITKPINYFQIDNDIFYKSANQFVNADIQSVDTLSYHYNAVKILQQWLKFRLSKSSEKEALVFADLARINFIKKYAVMPNSGLLYFDALKKLAQTYPNAQYTAYVKLKIADYYNDNVSKYDVDNPAAEIYKDYYVIALKKYNDIIKKYKTNKEIVQTARTNIQGIKSKSLSIKVKEVVPSNTPFAINIEYKNITNAYYEIRQIDYADYKKLIYNSDDDEIILNKLRRKYRLVESDNFSLTGTEDYREHSTETIAKGIGTGGYVVIVSSKADFKTDADVSYSFFQVSDLSLIYQEMVNGDLLCYVLNRVNGEPMSNVKVKVLHTEYNYTFNRYVTKTYNTYTSDDEGKVIVKPRNNDDYLSIHFEIHTNNDSLTIGDTKYLNRKSTYTYTENVVQIFTDRKLYRPGQTVYFKGIVLNNPSSDERKIIPNFNVNVLFNDVNWQKIAEQNFTSNEFGTFNGSFQIPVGVLNGQMQIYTSYGSQTIQVEEYKRPTFSVEMLPVDEQFLVNDTVTVKGKAENFSGVKLSDVNVKYTVKRANMWFGWYWWGNTDEVMITHGVAKTDDNGEFEIDFKATPNLNMPKSPNTAFSYTITVDVTDINGETQSTSSIVNVGYIAMQIKTNIDKNVSLEQIKDDKKISLIAQNLNGQDVDAQISIEVFKLKQPAVAIHQRLWDTPDNPQYSASEWNDIFAGNEYKKEADYRFWEVGDKIWTKNFNSQTDRKISIKDFENFDIGVYKMILKSKDAFGNDVETEEFFTIYSENSNKLPYPTDDWYVCPKTTYEVGETAKFFIGSFNKTTVLYKLYIGNKLYEEKNIQLNDNQKVVEIPITEEMRGGFNVSFVSITKNEVYSNSQFINVPYSNKKLSFEFTSFRDKLEPGQDEQWEITIKDHSGDFVLAELMTTLYDASLDEIMSNNWSFYPFKTNYNSIYWTFGTFSYKTSSNYSYYDVPSIEIPYSSAPSFNWFGYYYYQYSRYRTLDFAYTGGVIEKNVKDDAVYDEAEEIVAPVVSDKTIASNNLIQDERIPPSPPATQPQQPVLIRKNFNETAFFYPSLHTNDKGEIVIKFTIPESLTKWRFLGLAHTKDLKYNLFDKYAITQKELMVMPNAPRFFRQNDTMFFAAKIANLSGKDLQGTVTLEFTDEITGQTVNILAAGVSKSQNFSVSSGLNTPVKWEIIIPDDAKMLTYKIVAQADNYSDGEQKMLPVLSNRILITESLPLPIRANQTKKFKFTKLLNSDSSSTLKHEKITVEFTSNPVWNAVQALPYLIEYPYECSEQTFSRYYANTLASYIANSSPKIKAVFDTWKNYQPSALLSNLEKNQELKQLVLEETPWVLDAQDENQRKQNIALLFDLNRMANEQARALKKLKKDQSINGGWSWFKGMPESWYITQYIAEGIGHLAKLQVINGNDDADIFDMAEKAVNYTDREMKDAYDYLQAHYTDAEIEVYHPSQMIIHYLYTRTFFEFDLRNKYETPKDYYYNQLKKYWTSYGLRSQGMLALIFYRNGDITLANDIIKSLGQRATYHQELGMYWTENTSGYYWYQAPIETQALMIEVFNEVAKDKDKVDELKIWLLKNKQTNDWKTTTATAEAIYSLLITGGTDLLANSDICKVTIGNTTIDPKNNPDIETEAGTGYYKVSFDGSQVTADMGNIKVVNKNDIVAWGAVYWQYWEDLDKITPHETPLKLQKGLFKEIVTDRGEQLVPITDNTVLQIGDKVIVRIELRVDRDMEYVHMKDMRASGFEPINVISTYKWQDGLGYYETTKDASTNFFFDYLPKGTYVFEYLLRVTTAGSFSNGITNIQCMYAPEFTSHSAGQRVKIAE